MIEFNGYLTGFAKKHFLNKSVRFVQYSYIVAIILMSPTLFAFMIKLLNPTQIVIICFGAIIIPFTFQIKTKKGKQKITPKRIYVKDNTIVCITDTYTESKFIDDVKEVRDYGEFYYLIFPFGKISTSFVCQKNLLSNGTLEEFEALFEGKVVRKKKRSYQR